MSLSPGVIDTRRGRQERAAGPVMDRLLLVTPARRMGAAHEIAAIVAFLASPAASYITGTDLPADGGTCGDQPAGGLRKLLGRRA